ncbi:MAG: PDZ domain-containing protein [Bacillota bacterium]
MGAALLLKRLGEQQGLLLVMPGSPMEKAGLSPGDIIIKVDGKAGTL